MYAYTMKEAAKKINVPPSTIRQWEKDLKGLLEIPRSKQGARIYTDTEINLLIEIKEFQAKKLNKDGIRSWFQNKYKLDTLPVTAELETSIEIISETKPSVPIEETSLQSSVDFFAAMDTYKQNFLLEVKEEIRNVVRKEVLEEVKKEISKGALLTVKSLSDSIYKSSSTTKDDIQQLSNLVKKNADHTVDSMKYLSNSIASVSYETAEEIYNLSNQLTETTEDLSKYVDVTNNEIHSLTEALAKDLEFFIEEREQYRHDIRQREAAFQSMLTGFRDAAAGKERKWWKFWLNIRRDF
jgi:DNA-binding transcriptional MerR regulator